MRHTILPLLIAVSCLAAGCGDPPSEPLSADGGEPSAAPSDALPADPAKAVIPSQGGVRPANPPVRPGPLVPEPPAASGDTAPSADAPQPGVPVVPLASLPAGAGPVDSPASTPPSDPGQAQPKTGLDPAVEIAPVLAQLRELLAQRDQESVAAQKAAAEVAARVMKITAQMQAAQAAAEAARMEGKESEAVELDQKAEKLSAEAKALALPAASDDTEADLAFENRLLRFRGEIQAGKISDARASFKAMVESCRTASPAMLRALQNELGVLSERGGHY